MDNRQLILAYHLIYKSAAKKPFGYHPVFSIEEKTFARQIELIKSIKTKLLLTFDDGFESDYETTFPELERNKLKAIFFISLQNIKSEIRWKQYSEMLRHEHLIGSHGVTHQSFLSLSNKEVIFQFSESKKIIEDNTGNLCTEFSFPLGAYNSKLIDMGREAGYKNFYSTRCRINDSPGSENILHRFPVKHNYDLKFFEKIINANHVSVSWLKFKSDCSLLVKKIFKENFQS